ncbi:MAG: helix-turn-helix domain-containing protein [Bacteroidales bacterium]
MNLHYISALKGKIFLTDSFHKQDTLKKDKTLYKFIRVISGVVSGEIDHIPFLLHENEILSLTPLHHIEIHQVTGTYQSLLFNSDFYCIFGHDQEVSCNGILFSGSSERKQWLLSDSQKTELNSIIAGLEQEYGVHDNLQEEMLRILLKKYIISCTRYARNSLGISSPNEKSFEIIRQYFILVDQHFKEKKKVLDYAAMLNRSPKTLSNIFTTYGLPSPLRILHQRILSEAKRLLLYTSKSAKEIAYILGFDDQASFSRFFTTHTGENISEYRKREKKE